jgi:hypothetical protein
LVERHVAALQIVDDPLQRLKRLLEAHRLDFLVRLGGHRLSFHQAADMGGDRKC